MNNTICLLSDYLQHCSCSYIPSLSISYLLQVLLKPIVSQLVIEPPASLDDSPNLPIVMEVDDLLVMCIGQMAVTAGNDLLWKPLNHEVHIKTSIPVCCFCL